MTMKACTLCGICNLHYTRWKRKYQFYRAVQDVQSAARACVDKYTLRNSEGDPVACKRYAGSFAAPPNTPYATHAACLSQYVYIEHGSKTTKIEAISA